MKNDDRGGVLPTGRKESANGLPQPEPGKRVLIIDDDESVRDALRKVLEESGYAVVLAADGREGDGLLCESSFDLLILDLDLPAVSGFDLLDLTTSRQPSTPVIILTGMLDQCEPGALAGADAWLAKPPEVGELLRIMSRLLTEPAEERLRRVCHELNVGHPPRHGNRLPRLPNHPDSAPGATAPGGSAPSVANSPSCAW